MALVLFIPPSLGRPMIHLKKTDLWWLLGWPIYQLLGTARHELSHALVAALQAQGLRESRFSARFSRKVSYGDTSHGPAGTRMRLVIAAPYLGDIAVFLLFLPLCMFATRIPRWLWINCFILGLLSPFIDTAANYSKLFRRSAGDVNELVSQFSPFLVHSLFLGVMIFYLVGMRRVWRVYHRDR